MDIKVTEKDKNNNDKEVIRRGKYLDAYNIDCKGQDMKVCALAHVVNNILAGDLHNEYINKNAKMYHVQEKTVGRGQYRMKVLYNVEPYSAELDNARKKIEKAEELERPVLNMGSVKKAFGYFFKKIGLKFGFVKDIIKYEQELQQYNKDTNITEEQQLVNQVERINEENMNNLTEEKIRSLDASTPYVQDYEDIILNTDDKKLQNSVNKIDETLLNNKINENKINENTTGNKKPSKKSKLTALIEAQMEAENKKKNAKITNINKDNVKYENVL